jgi:hypothetical protein
MVSIIRHKNLLRRSFHIQMVPQGGMAVYYENTVKCKKFKETQSSPYPDLSLWIKGDREGFDVFVFYFYPSLPP